MGGPWRRISLRRPLGEATEVLRWCVSDPRPKGGEERSTATARSEPQPGSLSDLQIGGLEAGRELLDDRLQDFVEHPVVVDAAAEAADGDAGAALFLARLVGPDDL